MIMPETKVILSQPRLIVTIMPDKDVTAKDKSDRIQDDFARDKDNYVTTKDSYITL
jgi:hypothetical protein